MFMSVMIYIDVSRAWKIHKSLQHNQKGKDKENVMEINMAFVTKKLKEMAIKPPKEEIGAPNRCGMNHTNLTGARDNSE